MTYVTKFGPIFYDASGNDHRPNVVNFIARFPKRHENVKLQKAALEAFQKAESNYGRRIAERNGWKWKRRSRAIQVTGSWRSFDLQSSLYHSDPSRYASPYTSGHVQAIAIDVSTDNPDFELQGEILRGVGWKQARSDERWHFSWGPEV